jgi:hypothetical protein
MEKELSVSADKAETCSYTCAKAKYSSGRRRIAYHSYPNERRRKKGFVSQLGISIRIRNALEHGVDTLVREIYN